MNRPSFRFLLCAIIFWASLPGAAQAQCLKWDVNGAWVFAQSNGPFSKIQLQQTEGQIRGSATYWQYKDGDPFYQDTASVDGSITGDKMQLTVYWQQGAIGIYNARINPDGSVEGGTYDKRNPNTYATWTADRKATCSQHAVGIGADGRPAMALGRVKSPAPTAQCPRWDLGSVTRMTQSGTGAWVELKLTQTGNSFSGTADYEPPRGVQRFKINGHVEGTLSGNDVKFTAAWDDSKTGVYYGSIDSNGRVAGYTYEQDHHAESADWSMLNRAVCDTNYHAETTGLRLGRAAPRDPSAPVPSICDAARSARARNSPAAPGLERRCLVLGETTNVPISPLVDRAELDRLAALGLAVARADYSVLSVRRANPDLQYRYGFDVASALFGDPGLGGQGGTAATTESQNIRASLDPASQPGFDDSANFHFSRQYGP